VRRTGNWTLEADETGDVKAARPEMSGDRSHVIAVVDQWIDHQSRYDKNSVLSALVEYPLRLFDRVLEFLHVGDCSRIETLEAHEQKSAS